MNKRQDLISILLQETYGQIPQSKATEVISLSDYFLKKESRSRNLLSFEVKVYSKFVRVSFKSKNLDIPYGLGIVEGSLFNTLEEFELSPINDSILSSLLEKEFSKKVSWLGYSSKEERLYFLTCSEANGFGQIELRKSA